MIGTVGVKLKVFEFMCKRAVKGDLVLFVKRLYRTVRTVESAAFDCVKGHKVAAACLFGCDRAHPKAEAFFFLCDKLELLLGAEDIRVETIIRVGSVLYLFIDLGDALQDDFRMHMIGPDVDDVLFIPHLKVIGHLDDKAQLLKRELVLIGFGLDKGLLGMREFCIIGRSD